MATNAAAKAGGTAAGGAAEEGAAKKRAEGGRGTGGGRRPETRLALVRRARRMNRILAETYPDAHCELNFGTPFQLLVATVLSAQTTDMRVSMTTPEPFAKHPTPEDPAAANPEDGRASLRPNGFCPRAT